MLCLPSNSQLRVRGPGRRTIGLSADRLATSRVGVETAPLSPFGDSKPASPAGRPPHAVRGDPRRLPDDGQGRLGEGNVTPSRQTESSLPLLSSTIHPLVS